MPRPVWSGAISFGLVNVPVRLYTATESKDVRFRELRRGTGERVRHRRVAERSGEEVPSGEIVKGYPLDGDRYVVVEPEELEAAEPEKSASIAIEDFVRLGDIDPIYFDRTYYVAPPDRKDARRGYALLLQAMLDTDTVAVGRFVMRNKEYLVAIRPAGGVLLLETMYFADEIREHKSIDGLPVDIEPSQRELEVAKELVRSLSAGWAPERYRDTHREAVLELVERKAEGKEIRTETPRREAEPPGDLMDALRASVEEVKGRSSNAPGPPGREELRARSREELYEAAQQRGIQGRSRMSKDELVDALSKAS